MHAFGSMLDMYLTVQHKRLCMSVAPCMQLPMCLRVYLYTRVYAEMRDCDAVADAGDTFMHANELAHFPAGSVSFQWCRATACICPSTRIDGMQDYPATRSLVQKWHHERLGMSCPQKPTTTCRGQSRPSLTHRLRKCTNSEVHTTWAFSVRAICVHASVCVHACLHIHLFGMCTHLQKQL